MKTMAEVLAEHHISVGNDGGWYCSSFGCDSFAHFHEATQHQADALTAAGYGPVKAVLALADEWESKYGPGTRREEVFGPQKVSIKFAVKSIRTAVENALTP